MPNFDAIIIIYNPNSTGPSESRARELHDALTKSIAKTKIILQATKRAGHAEELAYKAAKKYAKPLVISASGDGGYHEVVNGALRAQSEGAAPTTGLLPAGNANDHFHSLANGHSLSEAVQNNESRDIDVLQLSYQDKGHAKIRYAHSYIGLGLSPQAGRELNRHSLNKFMEMYLVFKTLVTLRAVRLRVNGRVRTYDSLIFSNVPRMAKVLTLANVADVQDGLFEITAFRRRSKFRLLLRLLKASTIGWRGKRQAKKYSFKTVHPVDIQLDGEIIRLGANIPIEIVAMRKQLTCIL